MKMELKESNCKYAVIAAALVGGFFSFFHVGVYEGHFNCGWYLPIEADKLVYAMKLFADGRLAALAGFPLYIVRGLVLIVLEIAPYVLLAVSVLVAPRKRRAILIIAAQVVTFVGFPIKSFLWGEGYPDLNLAYVVLYCLIQLAFIGLVIAPKKKKLVAVLTCVALCAVFLVLMIVGVAPFGCESARYGKSLYISSYIAFACLWVASAFSIEPLAGADEASSQTDNRGANDCDSEKQNGGHAGPLLDAANQLKELKSLLDMGALTQEEFDAKKKDLLGL